MQRQDLKRFSLSPSARAALAAASQEYGLPMQEITGKVVERFARDYQARDVPTHRALATWRDQYQVILAARIARGIATRKANKHVKRQHKSKR